MHVISRDAKRRLVTDHHAPPSSLISQQRDQPSIVLFLPEILFQIGTLLKKHELWSCSLVCPTWHSVFSPFLDWMALDTFRVYMKKAKHQCSSCNGTREGDYKWCRPFLDALLQRVMKPDAAFRLHSSRNTSMSNWHLEYRGTGLDYHASNIVQASRVDVICLITEKSNDLGSFHLNMNQKLDGQPRQPCSWTRALQSKTEIEVSVEGAQSSSLTPPIGSGSYPAPPLSMTPHRIQSPNWPRLSDVTLQNCHLEYSFFQVLFSHAPSLDSVELLRVSFSGP